jgi:hypothetical protein
LDDLPTLLGRKLDMKRAFRAMQRWRAKPTKRRFRCVYKALLPLIRITVLRHWDRAVEDHAFRDDLEALAAFKLWTTLPNWPESNTEAGLLRLAETAISRVVLWSWNEQRAALTTDQPTDVVRFARVWNDVHTYGDLTRLDNQLYARELPEVIEREVLTKSRIPEHRALAYVVRAYMDGALTRLDGQNGQRSVKVLAYLQNVLGIPRRRSKFIVSYGVVLTRRALMRHRRDADLFLADRVLVAAREDEL